MRDNRECLCKGLGYIKIKDKYPILCPICGNSIAIKSYKCPICQDKGYIKNGCCTIIECSCKENKNGNRY